MKPVVLMFIFVVGVGLTLIVSESRRPHTKVTTKTVIGSIFTTTMDVVSVATVTTTRTITDEPTPPANAVPSLPAVLWQKLGSTFPKDDKRRNGVATDHAWFMTGTIKGRKLHCVWDQGVSCDWYGFHHDKRGRYIK